MSKYYNAQICLNGHTISSYSSNESDYCSECGEKTISNCPNCNANIRGKMNIDGIVDFSDYIPPKYCPDCGTPYPWTKSKLEAITELIEFDKNLSADEKSYINNNIQALTVDSPKTTVVATKFSYFLKKASSATISATRDILVEIASEAAKKIIFPQ